MMAAHKEAQRELNMIYSKALHQLATRPLFVDMPAKQPTSRLQRIHSWCREAISRLRDAWRVLTGTATIADQDDL